MASIDDEELVLHVRERLVVHDLLEEASLRLGGQSLDCGRPGFERRGVEGIREEVVIFSCHRYINYGGKVLRTECKDRGCSVPNRDGRKANRRKFLGQAGVM
jgi:hypothetical protein